MRAVEGKGNTLSRYAARWQDTFTDTQLLHRLHGTWSIMKVEAVSSPLVILRSVVGGCPFSKKGRCRDPSSSLYFPELIPTTCQVSLLFSAKSPPPPPEIKIGRGERRKKQPLSQGKASPTGLLSVGVTTLSTLPRVRSCPQIYTSKSCRPLSRLAIIKCGLRGFLMTLSPVSQTPASFPYYCLWFSCTRHDSHSG